MRFARLLLDGGLKPTSHKTLIVKKAIGWKLKHITYSIRCSFAVNKTRIIRVSQEEVGSLFEAVHSIKYRAIVMAMYAAGLRISEACRLQVDDLDSKRMLIRVRLGKGQKDRYTILSLRPVCRSKRPHQT